ncbi:hypothetical protein KAFR_0A08100 [Kazachstania africana CBS 2517]|uniref:Serine/threonine-protein kinase TOR n=1 Tax=Kazachstania africana (strain ATCC 22294 / BCRC 22015 / CBS 2517 / CECT 1963 / NBRC 1671 / NRRL Y-8276) TaxID=1071382 RepID=H2APE4_KAZAF|nr:hypothetical protein KAFR_0A08100 [Kazachstania africana CBS 2517]CCF56244.1 hypothetical protein KAFR_0A08100 [Kazachstania africana CBS 2517]
MLSFHKIAGPSRDDDHSLTSYELPMAFMYSGISSSGSLIPDILNNTELSTSSVDVATPSEQFATEFSASMGTFESIFKKLRSSNADERATASKYLEICLLSFARELSNEQFQQFNNHVHTKIKELVNNSHPDEQLAALAAISTLINFYSEIEELPNQVPKLLSYIRVLIPSRYTSVMRRAAETLGQLVIPGATLTSDFVESEVKLCLEWLTTSPEHTSPNSKAEAKKHAAILIISSLAKSAPYILYPYVTQILDSVWIAFRDKKEEMRLDTATMVKSCLVIIQRRDRTVVLQWYQKLLESCSHEAHSNTIESVHSCLLLYKELLILKHPCLNEYYEEIFQTAWTFRGHKSTMIRHETYALNSLLASFDSKLFASKYLNETIVEYLSKFQNMNINSAYKTDRGHILRSIGIISSEVGEDICPYLTPLLDIIRNGLLTKFKARKSFEKELFYCTSQLTLACGSKMLKYLSNGLLDLLLTCNISTHMEETLQTITNILPTLQDKTNSKLLDLVSQLLSGNNFKPPGSPVILKPVSLELARQLRNSNELQKNLVVNDDVNDVNTLIHALKMLQHIESPYPLSEFAKDVVIMYIEHNDPRIRKLAALTTCVVFAKDNICKQTSLNALNTVEEVLSKLLTVAITDPIPEIRLEILKHLDDGFDTQLAQRENMLLLFTALNDEVFAIRVETLKIIGRLTAINPAYLIPSLRKLLLELLTELKYLKIPRKNEESLTLLCHLISSTKEITKPYIQPLLDVLLLKAQDKSGVIASIALKSIGKLSLVGGEEMKTHIPRLMPLFINTLRDQSNFYKREAVLKTLGQLSTASGYVIEPLLDYPELLGVLTNVLRSDSPQNIKRETVRVLGILGALDPYKLRESSDTSLAIEQNTPAIDVALLMQNMSPSNDEYFSTVAIHTLLKILKDNSLTLHHTAVVQAILHIFQTLHLRCVSFLGRIIPAIISVMQNCSASLLEFYFQQINLLVMIVRQHIRPYADGIFGTCQSFFGIKKLQITIISLIESICKALEGEFKRLVPSTLTLFLNVLENDKSTDKSVSQRILKCIIAMGSNLEEYTHLILPQVIRITEASNKHLQRSAIITLGRLAKHVKLSEMCSRIIQTSLRLLNTGDIAIIEITMNTLSLILLQMNNEFTIFVPIVNRTLIQKNIQNSVYDQLVNKLLNNEQLPSTILLDDEEEGEEDLVTREAEASTDKLPINQSVLKVTWDCSQQRTREDWQEWIRRLSLQLLKESPSHALRACSGLASVYYPLARELFNVSFASIWSELYTQYQEDLIQSLCHALSSPQNPPEIHQTLLNLVEFMEHDDKALPISSQTLGEYAEKCHAYAKALHFKEAKFLQEPVDNSIFESLISINNQIHQNDSAVGILKYAQKHYDLPLQETWYEKLQRWEDALDAYSKRREAGDNSNEVIMGQMRSYHALSDWDNLSKIASERWTISDLNIQKKMAPLAASAAWSLGEWDKIEQYIDVMKDQSPDREFFGAVLSLHRNDFDEAERRIFNARDLLVTEISALLNESYNRAYNVIVRSQLITELEEIIVFKKLPTYSPKSATIRNTWNKRLLGCQKSVDVWQRALKVRSLVIKPKQDMHMWIKFANLCRKSGKLNLAEKALNTLLEDNSDPAHSSKAAPPVVYAQLKYLWASGANEEALRYLIGFTSRMVHDLGLDPNNMIAQSVIQNATVSPSFFEEYTKLLARCFLKQGEWRIALQPNWTVENPDAILGSYLLATHFDERWYKAWHNWALANFEVISTITANKSIGFATETDDFQVDKKDDIEFGTIEINKRKYPAELIQRHVVPAIKGFFHSISLSEASALQDTLRLLTLWFTFGGTSEAAAAMYDGFKLIKIGNWLEVLPQLISRIHQPDELVSRSLLSLLSDLGKAHPQVLVNPLIVAIKSGSLSRQVAARSIIEKMRVHSSLLVDQAELVCDELIRVAVLWQEQWYEGLEDASRQYFGEHNTEKMFATIEPLHELLSHPPETLEEASFENTYGRDLNDAYEWIQNYKRTKDVSHLNQAWDIYYNVFRRISRQLPQMQTLELQNVSPKLLAARDLELAVPGTYSTGKPITKISFFDPTFSVISSKQRPRKVNIRGSDGKNYQYALKGHEDIRQDNLVMQLFGLVNTLLEHDPDCFQRHLDIQQFPAIPLSPKSGLLGWVPNSDTFHVLIREHRDANKVPLNIEHWVMLQMAPDYDNITLLQKIEVFQYAMENTKGQDLAQILWLKSRSSEIWLDRRTVFIRSLAVMSMVGYILGLGDRHPSNLLLDKITGKVVHIDFGDCFEAAILREKFPEKVPFRLTRMLINAMEVSGIEGTFRITCENVMRVLRDNKESLMAILEAFAYDPLIQWGFDLPTEKIIEETGIQLQLSDANELLRKGVVTAEEARKLEAEERTEIRNARAVLVLRRITNKLTGNDISRFKELNVPEQVDKLIIQAMSIENLCQHYVGWCPFW